MPTITLKAHYDGERIVLDEPFDIPPNSPLIITVLPACEPGIEEDWVTAARSALSAAYGPEEPEYGPEDLRE
jgi:hypothetical protein